MVSDVTIGSALNQQASTQNATAGLADDFSQFLTLLTIQLQNQDPLSPIETNEFTNQLVAFTGVEQQINTNDRLDSLVALQLNEAFGGALEYVGLDVSYVSSEVNFDGETPADIRYALNDQAVSSTLRVLDEDGIVVFEGPAASSPGQHDFTWDGSLSGGGIAEPGTYRIQIDALDIDENGIGSTIVVNGNVSGVESQGGQIFAIVGERAVALGNILSASQPATVTVPDPEPDSGDGGST